MKISAIGYLIMMMSLSGEAGAKTLSGKFSLNNQDILVAGAEKYRGKFDLRSKLPMNDEFVLSSVVVSFNFQDDKEWIRTAGSNSLENTGKIVRHEVSSLRNNPVHGQTDHYYRATNIINLSNEEEVAKLVIGNNIYYATTIRRRGISEESLGQKNINLGYYIDEGDNNRKRQHHRITDSVLETHRDGYDGLFEIVRKSMDLATNQDLAHTGILNFELGGTGDYLFVDATLHYEGYVVGPEVIDDSDSDLINGMFWLTLISIPTGWLFWRKKHQSTSALKYQKRITRRKVPQQRAF